MSLLYQCDVCGKTDNARAVLGLPVPRLPKDWSSMKAGDVCAACLAAMQDFAQEMSK